MAACAGISLETALVSARQALASVAERAKQPVYYSGARTDIINSHADLRAALDMLVKAAGPGGLGLTGVAELQGAQHLPGRGATVVPRIEQARRGTAGFTWARIGHGRWQTDPSR